MNVQSPDNANVQSINNGNVQSKCTIWLYPVFAKGLTRPVTKGMQTVVAKGNTITVPFELSFEKTSHVYRIFDKVCPSVTTVMKAGGSYSSYDGIPAFILERAAEIGNEVHYQVEKWAKGANSALSSEDRSAQAYLYGFRKFVKLGVFEPLHSEIQLYDPDLWYAGTIDLVGVMNNRLCIIDVKTTNKLNEIAIGLQTAGYENLIGSWGADLIGFYGGFVDRFALHLKKNGTFAIHRAEDPTDWAFFKQLVEMYNGLTM